jgi:hypothetical protein
MNKATLKSLIREAKKEMVIKSIKENFDVDNDGDWNDPKKAGYMRQKDVAMGHGTVHFTSNSGTSYKVELSAGRIVSVIDGRDNTYEVPEIQKYWDKGFPLVGAIAATIGDNDSTDADEEEKPMLYPPEELQETNDVQINPRDLTDIEVDGIDKNDWPDFVDSYVVSATHKGRPLTPQQIEWLNQNHPDIAQDEVREKLGDVDFDKDVRENNVGAPSTGKFGIQVTSTNPSLGNKRSSWYHKNTDGTVARYNNAEEAESAIKDIKKSSGSKVVSSNRAYTSYAVGHLKEDKAVVESPGVIGKNEQSPPGFPRIVYEKLVIKFKGNKDKINEVMWKLHNEYGEKLKAAAGLVNEDTLDEK